MIFFFQFVTVHNTKLSLFSDFSISVLALILIVADANRAFTASTDVADGVRAHSYRIYVTYYL